MFITKLILMFFFYSVLGWILEVIYSFAVRKKLVNRGFLYGPLCPIYGVGALLVLFLLRPFQGNVLVLFLMTGLMTTALEYTVSYTLEKLFKTTWWDYSNSKFNVNGRICLRSTVSFGVVGVVVVKFLHPVLRNLIAAIPSPIQNLIVVTLVSIGCVDLLLTVLALRVAENRQRRFEICFALSGMQARTVFIN
jgi:uncharacterized membrane protein